MKKIRLSREGAYCLAILFMAFSVSLMTKADLGLSMIVSPSYILSQKFSFLSFGQAEYIVQFLLVVIVCIVTKKIKLSYAFSFITVLIYGAVLDLFCYLMSGWDVTSLWLRIFIFAAGMVITAFAVALFFCTYLSPGAYDFFVKQIADDKNLNLKRFKLGFDITFLVVSIILSLVFFKKLVGVSAGTVVIALLNGHVISFFSNLFEKRVEFFDSFPFAKYF